MQLYVSFHHDDKHEFVYTMTMHTYRIVCAMLHFLKVMIKHMKTHSNEIEFELITVTCSCMFSWGDITDFVQ